MKLGACGCVRGLGEGIERMHLRSECLWSEVCSGKLAGFMLDDTSSRVHSAAVN